MKEKKQWYCEWSSSLGNLGDTAENIWGTLQYDQDKHINESVVFFGLYGFPSFYKLWRHSGRKAILWCGSDIRHFLDGYWLDDKGKIRISPLPLAKWITENCESWVENAIEYRALKRAGIESYICPSFLGEIDKFEISYKGSETPKVYTSVSGDNFNLYAWDKIPALALQNPEIEFHLYGNTVPVIFSQSNVIVHGRVSKEEMNKEIKEMQGALRLTTFDGFSELLAKSLLWGQWPVSLIRYPHTLSVGELGTLAGKQEPNKEGREHYRKILNQFPWNLKK